MCVYTYMLRHTYVCIYVCLVPVPRRRRIYLFVINDRDVALYVKRTHSTRREFILSGDGVLFFIFILLLFEKKSKKTCATAEETWEDEAHLIYYYYYYYYYYYCSCKFVKQGSHGRT